MRLHQYDYIFAIGTLFAMLDAYNNGASKSYIFLSWTTGLADLSKMMLPIHERPVCRLDRSPTDKP